MDFYDYLIIGNGIAGATAAETIRERDPAGSVAVISDEPHPLYSRVLLPNYVKGLAAREQVFLRKRDDYQAKNIMLLQGESAVRLAVRERILHLAGGRTIGFGKLLIASGGRPRPLDVPGGELLGVSRFQTINDADLMRQFLAGANRAVVVGGGFIALEYLEILVYCGIPATLVIPQPYFFSRFFDAAGGELLQDNFRRHGIAVIAGERLAAIEGENRVRAVRLANGRTLDADFLGIGIGLVRNTAWLGAGVLLTGEGVAVNEYLEASEPGIFAAGDVADFNDIILGFRHSHGNWGNAFRQGDCAGRNMARPAEREPYQSVTSYGIRSLGLLVALVGYASNGPGIETISRLDRKGPAYGRYFLKEGRLVGAALINRHEERPAIQALIKSGERMSDAALAGLADPKFDIAALTP
ncbi:MAG: NAD(P)/FAD-dependent oxidoreductase [Candidatus Sungbacteria bacterium]|uniref:NAD(P)/FAD-dependent oxidoreductase n=1 Tax=Candidatus Sungiibacteriota bacterium TaxID=2750080 RepID=A0A932YVM0_9BACT|nr:NAD(P)/FAD-dependent oxidoreductase [Candidatus Sungbacteria bacterium]